MAHIDKIDTIARLDLNRIVGDELGTRPFV
jgi:hypothetical protein